MAEARPKAVVLAGPNGAGKSTLAPFLLRDTIDVSEFVNADTIALGLSAFRPETVALEAGRVMLRRLRELARNRASFAFETTLATRAYAPWLRVLRDDGYAVERYYLWLRSADLAVDRVEDRVRAGGHDVPEEVVRRRYRNGARNFFALYRPLAEAWRVYDTSVAVAPELLAFGSADATTVRDAEGWRLFSEAAG